MAHEKLAKNHLPAAARAEILRWTAGLGAVTADALAIRWQTSVDSARARLCAAERHGLLVRHRPLIDRPSLYTITRSGLRAIGARGLDPARVSAAGAVHLIECARVAAALELRYPDHRVAGERELRRDERERGRSIASAELGADGRARTSRHRPDLVLWPGDSHSCSPVAIEVELTVKAPERLLAICRAWARARCVVGVVYLVAPDVERALLNAVQRAHAEQRIAIVPLQALPRERPVPSGA
ncbi:MAG TPA: hypothetical protein VGL78_15240 [Solirubrobacteraceae bacterium]|jgi:hypothetical protein